MWIIPTKIGHKHRRTKHGQTSAGMTNQPQISFGHIIQYFIFYVGHDIKGLLKLDSCKNGLKSKVKLEIDAEA